MKKLLSSIIAFIFLFTTFSPTVEAFYSPILSSDAANIQQRLVQARQKHGVGNAYQIMKRVQKNRANNSEGELVEYFFRAVLDYLVENFANAGTDTFLLVRYWLASNTVITTCLRDDLWKIQILQEQILNEVFKAAFMGDYDLASQLWDDHQRLHKRVYGGNFTNSQGNQEVVISLKDSYTSSYWFPGSNQNFYINCPYGEYEQAIERLKESIERFRALGNTGFASAGSLKSIPNLARQRAIRRARQWVAANQISLSIGGPQGGNPQSLLRGAGFTGFWAGVEQQGRYLKNMADMIFVKTIQNMLNSEDAAINVSDYAIAYQKALEESQLVKNQSLQAMQYQLSFTTISENSLIQTDRLLVETNTAIKGLYDKSVSKEANAKSLCKLMVQLVKNQCTNKTPTIPEC